MNRISKKYIHLIFFSCFTYVFCSYAINTVEKYYSQVGQDEYIHKNIFPNKKNGVIIDIGAYDGVRFSNSLVFKQLGWKCICIEPLPHVFAELKKNRPDCICIQGCISDKEDIDQFLAIKGGCEMLSGLTSTYDPRHIQRAYYEIAQNRASYQIIPVQCYKLETLLNAYGITHIDILSLDTEGSEHAILKSIDFDRFSIDVICIEDNYGDQELMNFLIEKGFVLLTSIAMDAHSIERDLIFRNKRFLHENV